MGSTMISMSSQQPRIINNSGKGIKNLQIRHFSILTDSINMEIEADNEIPANFSLKLHTFDGVGHLINMRESNDLPDYVDARKFEAAPALDTSGGSDVETLYHSLKSDPKCLIIFEF